MFYMKCYKKLPYFYIKGVHLNSQKFITIQKQLLAGTLKKSCGLRVQCVP